MNDIELVKNELRDRFYNCFPGFHSNLKSIPEHMRVIHDRAEGTRLYDINGSEYLDYTGAYGPNILGHRHPELIESLHRFMDSKSFCVGASFSITENDVFAAEKIIRHTPCAEKVRFAMSGTEAVQAAIRVSRAYTGRPYVLQFKNHYHGWIDNAFGYDVNPNIAAGGKPFAIPKSFEPSLGWSGTMGRGPGAADGTLMIDWNDIETLENVLENHGQEIAMILMEAFAFNASKAPLPGYLEKVRRLCDQYGIVLCFDEVMTGFRVGLNSAQGELGVTPDICTLGKALGGGVPVSAVVGKATILDVFKDGRTVAAGTYMGNAFAMQAVKTTLEILERDDGLVYKKMTETQKPLMAGLDQIARHYGIPMRVQGFPGVFMTMFGCDPDVELHTDADTSNANSELIIKFWVKMKEEGIYSAPARWYPSIVHTMKDTEIVLDAANKVMGKL